MSNPTSDLRLTMLIIVLVASGCSKVPDMVEDRILTDKEGCAFILKRSAGDAMFVYRMKDADRDICKLGNDK